MQSKNIIVFNAPIKCGKDTIADHIVATTPSVCKMEMKRSLVDIVIIIYGVTREWWDNNYTRHGKELPRDELNGKSMRQALIHTSEVVIKPMYGKDFFGKRSRRIMDNINDVDLFVYSDGGFSEELAVIGEGNRPMLVRIHREGYNYDPEHDSRSYIKDEDIPSNWTVVDIDNNGTWDEFVRKVTDLISTHFK